MRGLSTDGQSVEAQVRQLTKAGCKKVFREVASGAKTDRAQLRRLLGQLEAGDVVTVTRLDRLARSTRDLLSTRRSWTRSVLAPLATSRNTFLHPALVSWRTWASTLWPSVDTRA